MARREQLKNENKMKNNGVSQTNTLGFHLSARANTITPFSFDKNCQPRTAMANMAGVLSI